MQDIEVLKTFDDEADALWYRDEILQGIQHRGLTDRYAVGVRPRRVGLPAAVVISTTITVMVVLIATFFVPTGYTIIPVVEITQQLGLLNSLTGIIIAMAGGGHVAAILLYAGYFRQVPRELAESAVIDGAGFFTIFFRVMLPLARPITATVTLLTFLGTWNAFFLPLVFTFSRPDLRTLSVGMQAFVGENSTDWAGMAAAATISLLPVVILFVLLQRQFVEGFAGAIKQ